MKDIQPRGSCASSVPLSTPDVAPDKGVDVSSTAKDAVGIGATCVDAIPADEGGVGEGSAICVVGVRRDQRMFMSISHTDAKKRRNTVSDHPRVRSSLSANSDLHPTDVVTAHSVP